MSKLALLHEEEFNQIRELTSLCFQSNDYFKNFPQIFKPENSHYFILLKEKDKLVSFCTVYPTYFYIPAFLTGYCIGSVCTHPDYRKKGYATQILAQAEAKVRAWQGDFIYLFSNKNELYERAGYQLCGETYLAKLKSAKELIKVTNKTKIISYTEENEIAKVWNFIVRNSKVGESLLSYLEFKDILYIKNMKIFMLIEDEKLCSVCFLNKGDDFQNVIHGIYYLHADYAKLLIADVFHKQKKKESFYLFPGVFYQDFLDVFDYQTMPTMYVKLIATDKVDLKSIFVRSLQGT